MKSWLLIGRAQRTSTNGLSFALGSQPFEENWSVAERLGWVWFRNSVLSDNDSFLKIHLCPVHIWYQRTMDTQKQSSLPVLKLLLSSANRRLWDKDDVGHFEMFLHLLGYLPFPATLYGTARWPQKWRDHLAILFMKSCLELARFSEQVGGQIVLFKRCCTFSHW